MLLQTVVWSLFKFLDEFNQKHNTDTRDSLNYAVGTKRTGQGVHIVPIQYGTGTVSASLQVQKPDLYGTGLTVRIVVSEDLSEPEPFGTRSVWQSLRIQTAVEISAQVHTFLRRCKA